MKKLLTLSALLLALTASSFADDQPGIVEEATWNQGDLSIDDVEVEEEVENPELFYRAVTPAQLEAHAKRKVQIVVNKSMKERGYQYLTVSVDGELQYEAVVSTAWERMAKAKTRTYKSYTPVGKFFPDGMQEKRFSNTWQVWLQHVVMFQGGVWMHATTPDHYMELGAPASGGCVRLHPRDAKAVFEIIKAYGMNETAITVLPHESDEPQIPWIQQKNRPVPHEIIDFRRELKILR